MPLDVVYTKSKSVWDEINPFIEKLVTAYKQSQETKWNNEWQLSAIADIEEANKPQEVNSFLEMQKIPKENLDLEGMKKFSDEAFNLLTMKEIQMSPEDFQVKPGVKSIVDTDKIQTKTMPDVKEFNDLYKFVSELPTGKVDWTDTMNLFKEKLESGRAMGTAAQQFLSMIMGQSMPTNQRQKVQQDFKFTEDIRKALSLETFDEEAFYREHPDMELKSATSTGHKTYGKKAEPTDELKIDVMKFLEENKDEWEFGSINSKGDFTIRKKDTTKKYDFETYKEAQQWTKAHPQEGFIWKIDPQPEGFNVSAVKKTVTPQGGGTKLVPSFGVINSINEALLNPGNDYDTELHNAQIKYNLEGVKLITKADQAKRAYDMFEGIILDEDNEYIDEKGFIKDEEAYMDYYNDYERFAETYFKETGTILPKKYLSLEEAGIYTKATWGTGEKGGYKPVRNEDGIPWSWYDATEAFFNQMQRTNTKPEDVNWEKLAKEPEMDIDRLRGLLGL